MTSPCFWVIGRLPSHDKHNRYRSPLVYFVGYTACSKRLLALSAISLSLKWWVDNSLWLMYLYWLYVFVKYQLCRTGVISYRLLWQPCNNECCCIIFITPVTNVYYRREIINYLHYRIFNRSHRLTQHLNAWLLIIKASIHSVVYRIENVCKIPVDEERSGRPTMFWELDIARCVWMYCLYKNDRHVLAGVCILWTD